MAQTRPHGAGRTMPTLEMERAALALARDAVQAKLDRLRSITGGGADEVTDEYIQAVTSGAIEKMQQELVVFGRIDDDHTWRVGLYGIDSDGEQLVVDWRAPFAQGFYQAGFDDPRGLARRVSYVGCIADLLVEDFVSGEVSGSSPLMTELSRSRGTEMRAAVATLQSEQDELVRLDPDAKLVLRGGPGTGKTVVALHRSAWLVYNDRRITADRILVLGPSDRFLRFVSAVLPTLGEARILQTTFDRLLGPGDGRVDDEQWIEALDRFEASLYQPAPLRMRGRSVSESEMAELIERSKESRLAWRDRRKIFVANLAARMERPVSEVSRAVSAIWPACTTKAALAKLRRLPVLRSIGLDAEVAAAWLANQGDGAVADEVRARFEGVPARYSHVIVDEAQDMSLLQLRAVLRRSKGLTLVGDDAQRSRVGSLGLRRVAVLLDAELEEMATAYRMSAEIADWLNTIAAGNDLDAVTLVGIRPTGRPVRVCEDRPAATIAEELEQAWETVAVIAHGEVWAHKGIEYDAVVVDRTAMSPRELYLAASRAAHELVLTGSWPAG